jgi:hypothetical protein
MFSNFFHQDKPKTLENLLEEIPDHIFFAFDGSPNINAIFIEFLRHTYGKTYNDFQIPAKDFLNGTIPNLSVFQKAVNEERRRRVY